MEDGKRSRNRLGDYRLQSQDTFETRTRGQLAPDAVAGHRYPNRRPSTRQLCPADLV
jgi:hypothetical protein